MVFCSLIASSAIRAFISALKLRRCLDFISAPFPRQRFYTLLTGPNSGEHFSHPDWEEAKTIAAIHSRPQDSGTGTPSLKCDLQPSGPEGLHRASRAQ